MASTESSGNYGAEERAIILDVAAEAIAQGLEQRSPWVPDTSDYAETLRQPRASFVTLEMDADLRGCIGALEAYRPLVQDVAHNAFAAAFQDPRFPPLSSAEYPRLTIKVSVLTAPEPLAFASEAELLQQLRPGADGLILKDARHRGTFLPAVWEQLPDPIDFLAHLKRKAGLPMDYWSNDLEVLRYTTESFARPPHSQRAAP
ncbi:AmmeMemoRadiSam system protein A [Thiorhodococcus mannitoliphagus]